MEGTNNSTSSDPQILSEPLDVTPISHIETSTTSNFGVAGEGETYQPPAKRKRGRPRKYDMPLPALLGFVPPVPMLPSGVSPPVADSEIGPASGSGTAVKRGRGRPKGSGKSVSCLLSEWMSNFQSSEPEGTVTRGIIDHIDMEVLEGEDIAAKIVSYAKNTTKAVLVLSACGNVSTAILQRSHSSSGLLRYEGNYKILKLNGCIRRDYRGRKVGSLTVSLQCQREGRILGGSLGGSLIADGDFKLVLGAFKQDLGLPLKRPIGETSEQVSGFLPSNVRVPVPLRCFDPLTEEEVHFSEAPVHYSEAPPPPPPPAPETPQDSPAEQEGFPSEKTSWALVPRNPNLSIIQSQTDPPSSPEAADDSNTLLIPNPNYNRMNFADHRL